MGKSKELSNEIVVERKKRLYKYSQHVVNADSKYFLARMNSLQEDGYIRGNLFGHEIVWNERRYTFTDIVLKNKKEEARRDRNKKNMFIFACVKRDADKYVKNFRVPHYQEHRSINKNKNFSKSTAPLCGTDIDGAYWRIAWQKGVISENTYKHGLRINDKELCLAALANLGADKTYSIIKGGEVTKKLIKVKGDPKLKEAYSMIRHTCYTFMNVLSGMLGNDFIIYKTDCIFYVRSQKNIEMVTEFLNDHELDHKMMLNISRLSLLGKRK